MPIGKAAVASAVTLSAGVAAGIVGTVLTGGCADFTVFSLGNCGSKAEIHLSNEIIVERVYETLQETQQRVEENIINLQNQKINLNNYNSMVGCNDLEITQEMNVNVVSNTIVSTTMINEMLKGIKIKITYKKHKDKYLNQ